MEITKGILDKFRVAELILKPPIVASDLIDMEILLTSDTVPGIIKGYLTVTYNEAYVPRVHPGGRDGGDITLSNVARKKLRKSICKLAKEVRSGLRDV